MQNIKSYRQIRRSWTHKQIKSFYHWLAVVAFGLLSIAPLPVVIAVVLGISVISAIVRIPSLILTAIVVSFVTVLFPPLAGIISIIFLVMKLAYIVEHIRPLLLGAGLIGYLFYFSFDNSSRIYLLASFEISSFLHMYAAHFIFSALLFHLVLWFLYKKEYSTKEAVLIMATVPLFIFLLILPFLLRQLEGMDELFEGDSFDEYERYYYEEPSQDKHVVRGHIRQNEDGSISHVKSHIRTNPDGIEINNLSHKE